jgi:thymidylate synthase (FAD)
MIDVTYIDHMGSDLTVVNAARVSFGKKQESFDAEKDSRLIRYLARYRHTSPFGHCFASFHVRAPVFVARQLVKHKFLRWNEISRRYVDEEPEFYMPDVWRGRSADKKQGSEGELRCPIRPEAMYRDALDHYKVMIDWGICPEQARMVLPQSMMTEWYWSGSLDAFADMCHLRCKPDTQAETREVAEKIEDLMINRFPVSWEALRMYAE